jgi:hypothetical protein
VAPLHPRWFLTFYGGELSPYDVQYSDCPDQDPHSGMMAMVRLELFPDCFKVLEEDLDAEAHELVGSGLSTHKDEFSFQATYSLVGSNGVPPEISWFQNFAFKCNSNSSFLFQPPRASCRVFVSALHKGSEGGGYASYGSGGGGRG